MTKKEIFHKRRDGREYDLEGFIALKLDGRDYEHGALETAHATAENATNAITKLTKLLYDKKLLSREDIFTIFGN